MGLLGSLVALLVANLFYDYLTRTFVWVLVGLAMCTVRLVAPGREPRSAAPARIGWRREERGVQSSRAAIRRFIVENFLFGQDAEGLRDDMSLLERGVIDSTGVLELVAFLESTYGLFVADEDLVPENFDSVDNLAAYIARKAPQAP